MPNVNDGVVFKLREGGTESAKPYGAPIPIADVNPQGLRDLITQVVAAAPDDAPAVDVESVDTGRWYRWSRKEGA